MSGLRIGVVINPTAGRGRGEARGRHLLAAVRDRGHTILDLTAADLTSAELHVRPAVVHGVGALVVVGGDGMVHLGANVVAGTDLPRVQLGAGQVGRSEVE